jgi:hypothetical protein
MPGRACSKNAARLFVATLCFGVLLIACGCSGITASKSFSPLDFFLPRFVGSPTNQPSANTLLSQR